MLLAINANNTNTVVRDLGRRRAARAAGASRPTAKRTADEYVVWLDHLLGARRAVARPISTAR